MQVTTSVTTGAPLSRRFDLTCPPRLRCRPLTKIYKGPPEEGVETGIRNGRKLGFCESANPVNRAPYPLIGGYGTTTSGGPFCF